MYCKISTQNILLVILFTLACSQSLSAQQFEWARAWGSTSGSGWIGSDDIAYSVTTDIHGNVYTTGVFIFPADFDPGPDTFLLSPIGSDDAFISKLDASGNFVWARRMGGTFYNYQQEGDKGLSIATDILGNVYVTGFFKERADFGQFTLTALGNSDVFICKLDPQGNFLWAQNMGDSGTYVGNAIKADSQGYVYVGGSFQNERVGGGLYVSGNGGFLAKLDASGNFIWVKQTGIVHDMVLDAYNQIHITGNFQDTVDFDPGTGIHQLIAPPGVTNLYVAKLDNNANLIWVKSTVCDFLANSSRAIAVDAQGSVYYGGVFKGVVDFDPGPGVFNLVSTNPTTSGLNIFVSKLDSTGDFLWAKGIGGPHNQTTTNRVEKLALDEVGSVYITGGFDKRTDFDPGPDVYMLTNSSDDIFILKLDTEGNFIWAQQVVGSGSDAGYSIHVDPCDNIYTSGFFADYPDFDPGPGVFNLRSVGHRDAFVIKLSQSKIPYITVDTFDLGVSESYSTYQWYLNGEEIPGATDSIHVATENGDYMVVVANSKGCIDSTPVYKVTNVYDDKEDQETALPEFATTAISVYPNPAGEVLYIQSSAPVQVILSGIEGKELRKANSRGTGSIDISGYTPGIYLLQIHDGYGRYIKTEKIIKQ